MSTITVISKPGRTSGYSTDSIAKKFLLVSLSYLLIGITIGTIGSFQYLLPDFLKEYFTFQKSRPLHVYLAISWIFTAAQGLLYYFIPRAAHRTLAWKKGPVVHLALQVVVSLSIITGFFAGQFGGREYLEFPPYFAILIAASWLPLAYNFFATIKPNYSKAPVYIWMWSAGIIFFFLTLGESYLWTFENVNVNPVRDTTIQWKALGAMVGSWNMLIYGSTIFLMKRLGGDRKMAYSKESFFFVFVGLTNLMFNWGHHTYVVPAAPWIATTSYIISMTELLIFGNIILKFRKTITNGMRFKDHVTHKLLFMADLWIFLNLALAIAISVPAINIYTHGTHITVAHAMGATIGINTMLLLAGAVYITKSQDATMFSRKKSVVNVGVSVANISLLVFWLALIGSGMIRIFATLDGLPFQEMMNRSKGMFKWFAGSGTLLTIGLLCIILPLISLLSAKSERKHSGLTVVRMEERKRSALPVE